MVWCRKCQSSSIYWIVLCVIVLFVPPPAWPASANVGGANKIVVPVKSLKDLRDRNLVKQTYDYSCGGAALATLLTYGLADTVTEASILQSVLASLSDEEQGLRKQQGLSLFDLQRVAQARGHKAQGFWLPPAYLPKVTVPVIVFIKPRGYKHFAVLRGVRGDRVYLADPSLGNVRMSADKFLEMWLDDTGKGIIFVAERADGTWADDHLLKVPAAGRPQPEILTTRQMLEIGNPYVRSPHLFR